MPDPIEIAPAGPSRVELHLGLERLYGPGSEGVITLAAMLDLRGLGEPPEQGPPTEMSVAVVAPASLTAPKVAKLVDEALNHLASGFGFRSPATGQW